MAEGPPTTTRVQRRLGCHGGAWRSCHLSRPCPSARPRWPSTSGHDIPDSFQKAGATCLIPLDTLNLRAKRVSNTLECAMQLQESKYVELLFSPSVSLLHLISYTCGTLGPIPSHSPSRPVDCGGPSEARPPRRRGRRSGGRITTARMTDPPVGAVRTWGENPKSRPRCQGFSP